LKALGAVTEGSRQDDANSIALRVGGNRVEQQIYRFSTVLLDMWKQVNPAPGCQCQMLRRHADVTAATPEAFTV